MIGAISIILPIGINRLRCLCLQGKAKVFRNDMTEFVEDMRSLIPKTFESSDYDQQKGTIIQVVQEKVDAIFRSIEQEALKAGFIVRQAPGRVALIPIKDGKQLSPEEYKALSAERTQKSLMKIPTSLKKGWMKSSAVPAHSKKRPTNSSRNWTGRSPNLRRSLPSPD